MAADRGETGRDGPDADTAARRDPGRGARGPAAGSTAAIAAARCPDPDVLRLAGTAGGCRGSARVGSGAHHGRVAPLPSRCGWTVDAGCAAGQIDLSADTTARCARARGTAALAGCTAAKPAGALATEG